MKFLAKLFSKKQSQKEWLETFLTAKTNQIVVVNTPTVQITKRYVPFFKDKNNNLVDPLKAFADDLAFYNMLLKRYRPLIEANLKVARTIVSEANKLPRTMMDGNDPEGFKKKLDEWDKRITKTASSTFKEPNRYFLGYGIIKFNNKNGFPSDHKTLSVSESVEVSTPTKEKIPDHLNLLRDILSLQHTLWEYTEDAVGSGSSLDYPPWSNYDEFMDASKGHTFPYHDVLIQDFDASLYTLLMNLVDRLSEAYIHYLRHSLVVLKASQESLPQSQAW